MQVPITSNIEFVSVYRNKEPRNGQNNACLSRSWAAARAMNMLSDTGIPCAMLAANNIALCTCMYELL